MRQKPTNEKLGTWKCGGGGVADIFQTIKAGNHFYTRCDCCGLNQGTGAARQQRIFDEGEFIDKSAIKIPSGVSVGACVGDEPLAIEQQKTEQAQPVGDWSPSEMQEQDVEPVKEQAGTLSKIAPLFIVLLAVGAGVWMN